MRHTYRIAASLLFASVSFGAVAQTEPEKVRVGLEIRQRAERPNEADIQGAIALHEALISVPVYKQRSIVAMQEPAIKSALWRHNIDLFVVRHAELTRSQLEIVASAKKLLSPAFFETINTLAGDRARIELLELRTAADKVLSPELQQEAFFFINAGRPDFGVEMTTSPRPESQSMNCQCHSNIDCGIDFWNRYCQIEFEFMCEPVPHNCGWSMIQACDGLCV